MVRVTFVISLQTIFISVMYAILQGKTQDKDFTDNKNPTVYNVSFNKLEDDAKKNNRGIWKGKFEKPEEWRKKNK